MSVILNKVGLTVTFNVAKLSQPETTLISVTVWDSVVVNVIPFQSKGNSVSHTVVSVSLNKVGFTVTFKVAKLSQPVTALISVAVWDSVVVNVIPFHVYGS